MFNTIRAFRAELEKHAVGDLQLFSDALSRASCLEADGKFPGVARTM